MQIKGFFTKEIFRNHQNGYAVIILKSEQKNILCSGIIQELPYFAPICLTGDFGRNPNHPETFVFDSFEGWDNSKENDILYLANGLELTGISVARAEQLIKKLPMPLFELVKSSKTESEFTENLPEGFQKYGHSIYLKINQAIQFRELFDTVVSYGGNYSDAIKINDMYPGRELQMLNNHPYVIGSLLNWRFDMCDHIAKANNISPSSEERAKGICRYVMNSSLSAGNTYCNLDDFFIKAQHLMQHSPLGNISISYLTSFLLTEKTYTTWENEKEFRIAFKTIRDAEISLTQNVSRLIQNVKSFKFNKEKIAEIESEKNIQFSDEQKITFEALKSSGIKIITGGPGCGKTTVIDGLIRYIREELNEDVCLCAPTGCAAQHMSEKSGLPASTFHYLLGVKLFEIGCVPIYNQGNQLTSQFYIMDEFSIADIEIVSLMFSAIPNDACVIIVGDPGQLESVGAGDVLNDFISSGLFEVYRLNEIFRQKKGSNIIQNAKKAEKGEADFTSGEDFSLKHFATKEEAIRACILYSTQQKDGMCQVLSPIKKEKSGVHYLNHQIQRIRHKGEQSLKVYGDYEFYLNDRVITIKNNRKEGYFNGEPGRIKFIDADGFLIHFDNGEEIYIKNASLDEVIPAHALTIHKSQGSEYPEVAILLTEDSVKMINRKILYTAITRAKEKVSIFYQDGVLNKISNSPKRCTELQEQLIALY